MYRNNTGEAIYVNADRSKTVKENDPDAAYLLVGPNGELPDDEAEKYGLKGKVEQLSEADARKAALAAAEERNAVEEARVHRARLADAEAEEKALKSAPENKAVHPQATKAK